MPVSLLVERNRYVTYLELMSHHSLRLPKSVVPHDLLHGAANNSKNIQHCIHRPNHRIPIMDRITRIHALRDKRVKFILHARLGEGDDGTLHVGLDKHLAHAPPASTQFRDISSGWDNHEENKRTDGQESEDTKHAVVVLPWVPVPKYDTYTTMAVVVTKFSHFQPELLPPSTPATGRERAGSSLPVDFCPSRRGGTTMVLSSPTSAKRLRISHVCSVNRNAAVYSGAWLMFWDVSLKSSCLTGANDIDELADQGIHLIAAFQLIGFSHVIGTLWQVADSAWVDVGVGVYQGLYGSTSRSSGSDGMSTRPVHESRVGIESSLLPTREDEDEKSDEIVELPGAGISACGAERKPVTEISVTSEEDKQRKEMSIAETGKQSQVAEETCQGRLDPICSLRLVGTSAPVLTTFHEREQSPSFRIYIQVRVWHLAQNPTNGLSCTTDSKPIITRQSRPYRGFNPEKTRPNRW
ncbi:hypothetical protein V8F33_001961 [Rhypophila sp. PSN 637]